MRVSVCDDEPAVRDLVAREVRECYPEAEISLFASGEELLYAEEPGDILFLDIRLTGSNGMEIARVLRKRNKKTILIFLTAVREYVFEAFDVGAFHYLVKPFEDGKFFEVLGMAAAQWEEMQRREAGQADYRRGHTGGMEETGQGGAGESRFLLVKNGGLSTRVLLDDIIYAEVFNRKVTLHGREGDLEYYGKLSELEKIAGESFFRPHRAYLVNFKYVERYNATEIVLEKGRALMAKQNYSAFVKSFMRYNQRLGEAGQAADTEKQDSQVNCSCKRPASQADSRYIKQGSQVDSRGKGLVSGADGRQMEKRDSFGGD